MPTTNDAHIQRVFQNVVIEFKKKLDNDELYAEILKTTSIDQVYDATDKLQEEQGKNGRIRHLSKIGPYLERLRDYAGAIEVFVQAKPDILALIWGPIKLLIQWTSALKESFDAIVNITAQIGSLLPEFKEAALMFGHVACLNDVLALFFQDILDFYIVALQFFKMSRWRLFFEALWPKQKDRIQIVITHIEQHASLMRNEVRREDIRAEHEARLRALEHFEKMEKTAIHQEYNAIHTHISPTSYDDTLNRIESRLCDGTGKWLVKDSAFRKWLDPADGSTRRIWLQGIPGAGKTFLAAIAIRCAMAHGKTIFAYLGYSSSSSISALSIFHSLIFQVTHDDHEVQALLCRLGRENLRNDLEVATELLKDLLNYTGVAYLILDGIDEITEVERSKLLQQLVRVAEGCKDARILISSRPEADITACIDPEFRSICVNDRNSGSIQAFITRRTKQWLAMRDFFPEDQGEIEALLAPLASKAKGMFLYAEVVLNTIKNLEKEEILTELSILPEDLNAAYLRVLNRINNMPPLDANKARNILGWIGCSPTPLTIYEMEQALRVTAEQDAVPKVSSRLNVMSLCGPIVEVVDEFVGFVHFTVKEYLFSPRIPGYIDSTEATLSLAKRCIWYLCQTHHDPSIDDDELEANVVSGAYRLHYYASTTWLELVEGYVRLLATASISSELISALDLLSELRTQVDFEQPLETELSKDMLRSDFEPFKNESPKLYPLLCQVAHFRRGCATSEHHVQQRVQWATLDPLIIFEISAILHEQLDQLSCSKDHKDSCHCSLLQRHYGDRRFKCGFLSCPTRRYGFSTRSKRDSHEKHHSRQWKCVYPSCEYFEIGFLSRRMRDEHSESHRQGPKPTASTNPKLDADELQPLLFDVIRRRDIETFALLLPQVESLSYNVLADIFIFACSSGPVPIMKLMHDRRSFHRETFSKALVASIKCDNEEAIEWLLEVDLRGDSPRHMEQPLAALFKSRSTNAFEKFRSHIIARLTRESPLYPGLPPGFPSYSKEVIKATDRIVGREELLLGLWKDLASQNELSKFLSRKHLENALRHVAETTCSITLARQLIAYGASVDARKDGFSVTPLQRAARQSSANSAQFIKFLLYHGADPKPRKSRSSKLIEQEKGALEISKWLGLSWNELIEKVEADKEKGIGWPGS